MGLLWSPKLKRFVSTEKSFQLLPSAKHLPDHGRTATGLPYRRVLTIRSSPDGRQWEPSDSLIDVWGDKFKPLPDQWLTIPDADDPPDLEFYRGNGFWYHDRAFLVVLKVIPGFEREHCVIQDCNRIDQPLRWKGDAERSARQLAGRTIRLRFYLRGANVYAVTSTQR